jgi:hypothetical protein
LSAKVHDRIVRVRAVDDTTPILLGITRTMGGMRREISALRMMLKLLADDEFMAALAAGDLAAMLQMAIPIIGIAAGFISILAGAEITAHRAAIPIGQTLPGQYREMTAGGPIMAHKGEIISRPMEGGGAGGEGGFNVNIASLNMRPDGESPEAIGRLFRTVRNSYSSDIPMT